MLLPHILSCLNNLESKGGIYDTTHSIDLSSKVETLSKKFNQLLCMNKVANSVSMRDVCSIYASPMHASFEWPLVGLSNEVAGQLNVAQGFSPTNNPYSNTYNRCWKNHLNFSWKSQNVENPQAQTRPTPPSFQNQRYAKPPPPPPPSMSSSLVTYLMINREK